MNRFLPTYDIKNTLSNNLSKNSSIECLVLAFYLFSHKYDNLQKIDDLRKYLERHYIKENFSGFVKFKNMKAAVIRGIKN